MGIFGWVSAVVPINQLMGFGEEAFAEAGAVVYEAAAKTIAGMNAGKEAEQLKDDRKIWLRPNFSSLVDTVRVVYGADLIPSINVLGVKLETSTIAQTFGDRVYVKKKYAPDSDKLDDEKTNQLVHLAHELVHVRQFHNRGKSLHKFGKDYFRGFLRSGFSYKGIRMEVEAFDFNRCFQKRLFSGIAVPETFRSTLPKGLTSFMPFFLNNDYHFLAYSADSGIATIGRIHSDGKGIDTIWSTTASQQWTKGWTSFVPFFLDGKNHYLAYKSGSGEVSIDRIRPDGQGVDTIWKTQGNENWTKGWTSFVPFSLGLKPHYLAYKVGNGQATIDRVRADGKGVDTIWKIQGNENWTKGWTSFVPFVLNSQQHYLAYKEGTGTVHIDRIRPDGQGIDNVWKGEWSKDWTSMIGFKFQSAPHILAYKVESGYTHVERINDGGIGTTNRWCDQWTEGWTNFFAYVLKGKPFHLAYKKNAGTVAIDSIEAV